MGTNQQNFTISESVYKIIGLSYGAINHDWQVTMGIYILWWRSILCRPKHPEDGPLSDRQKLALL
jgi:hypothetical protein